MSSVCLSVTLVDHDHIGWKSWKLISRTISPTSLLFVAERSSTYSQGNMEKSWEKHVRSIPASITSSWIESTESHVILGGCVAVCLFTFFGASRGHLCDSTACLFVFHAVSLWKMIVCLLSSFTWRCKPGDAPHNQNVVITPLPCRTAQFICRPTGNDHTRTASKITHHYETAYLSRGRKIIYNNRMSYLIWQEINKQVATE